MTQMSAEWSDRWASLVWLDWICETNRDLLVFL